MIQSDHQAAAIQRAASITTSQLTLRVLAFVVGFGVGFVCALALLLACVFLLSERIV